MVSQSARRSRKTTQRVQKQKPRMLVWAEKTRFNMLLFAEPRKGVSRALTLGICLFAKVPLFAAIHLGNISWVYAFSWGRGQASRRRRGGASSAGWTYRLPAPAAPLSMNCSPSDAPPPAPTTASAAILKLYSLVFTFPYRPMVSIFGKQQNFGSWKLWHAFCNVRN